MSIVVYKSSAGSGKTTTLVNEYLSLALKMPDDFRFIIALTFTIKATTEMKDRVFTVLDKLIHLEEHRTDPGLLHGLEHIKKATNLNENEIRVRAKRLLQNILHQYSDFAFSTIDSFVVSIVRSFAHDLNLPMDFNIELDTEDMLDHAISLLFEKIGQDEVLTEFLIQYILQNVDNEKSLRIEIELGKLGKALFNSKNYKDLDLLSDTNLGVFEDVNSKLLKEVKIFEAEVAKIGQQGIDLIDKNNIEYSNFSRSTLPKQLNNLINGIIDTEHTIWIKPEENPFYPKSKNQSIKDEIDSIKDGLVHIINKLNRYFEKYAADYYSKKLIIEKLNPMALLTELKRLLDQYSDENNIIHLSESNKKIAEIVMNEHIPFVYERVGKKYRHFLVDEFQDTSVIQWNNLLPLIDNSLSSNYFNMLVGDAKQSIYRWRDGDVDQFIDLPKVKGSETSSVIKEREDSLTRHIKNKSLKHNYRSEKNIIEFNNRLFKYLLTNSFHDKKKNNIGFNESERIKKIYQDFEQIPGKSESYGKVILQNYPKKKAEEDQNPTEAGLVQHIKELQSQNYQLQDIAIIARTNKALHNIADILVRNSINVVSSETLFIINNAHVRLIISTMQFIANRDRKNNFLNIIRILNQTQKGKQEYILQNIEPLLSKLTSSNGVNILIQTLHKMGYKVESRKLLGLQAYDLVEYLLYSLKLNDKANPFLQSLLNKILENGAKNGAGINAFLDYWESKGEKISISLPDNINAIRLLSIHKAKGLEFPIVIFPAWGFRNHGDELWVDPKEVGIETLQSTMVLHKETMRLSKYPDQYIEEKDKMDMDTLNLIYVCLTRPSDQLIILFDSNKKDSLWKYFKGYDMQEIAHKDNDENCKVFGQIKPIESSRIIEKENIIEKLISNPWGKRISLKENSNLSLTEERITKINKGKLVHHLLSELNTVNQIPLVVNQAKIQGLISNEEVETYELELNKIISHPDITEFFNVENKEINETAILLPDGKQLRPDKVIIKENETQIVDYKLSEWDSISEKEKQKYFDQINTYRKLIEQMGYPNVKAYLLYIEGEINCVEVEA